MANASSGPELTLPASESISTNGTVAVSGASYIDNFAESNPGSMYLGISDNSGILSGFYPASGGGAGSDAAGNGSTSLIFQGSYTDVAAILNSLTYAATATSGSDSIRFDLWNQAGVQTTGTIPVSIGTASGGSGSGGGGSTGGGSTGGGGGTTGGGGPTFIEPPSETVTTGGTVAISGSYSDSFAATNPGSVYFEAIAQTGTVYATDASGHAVAGSGTNAIRLSTDYADIQAAVKSLTYVAGPNAGSGSIHLEVWNQAGVMSADNLPVTITGSTGGTGSGSGGGTGTGGGGSGGSEPALNEPASLTVASNGSVSVGGSYSDSYAAGNPGSLYLGITDSNGTLSATDAAGKAVAGSGTHNIGLSTDYVDLNAILASLHYSAGTGAASDTIQFDVWNQAGIESTGTTTVTIGSATAPAMTMADLAQPIGGSANSALSHNSGGVAGAVTTDPYANPVVLPPVHQT